MKKITKESLLNLRRFFAEFKTVGIDPRHAAALIKLWRLTSKVAEEISEEQKLLVEKFDIKTLPDKSRIDTSSEHFKEYVEAYSALAMEEVDLTEYCVLTFDEACIATAGMDLTLPDKDFIVSLLTTESDYDIAEK